MFSFKKLSDEELNAINNRGLLLDGVYSFTVKGIEATTSQSGNDMLRVTLLVADDRNLTDYLVTIDSMIFKLKHFLESIGLGDKWDEEKFALTDCIGRKGQVKIGVQKGKPRPDGSGLYPDKNVVKDYVKRVIEIVKPSNEELRANLVKSKVTNGENNQVIQGKVVSQASPSNEFNDDIPF